MIIITTRTQYIHATCANAGVRKVTTKTSSTYASRGTVTAAAKWYAKTKHMCAPSESAGHAEDTLSQWTSTSTSVIATTATHAVRLVQRMLIMCVNSVVAQAAAKRYCAKSGMIICQNALDSTRKHVEYALIISAAKRRSARIPCHARSTNVGSSAMPRENNLAF